MPATSSQAHAPSHQPGTRTIGVLLLMCAKVARETDRFCQETASNAAFSSSGATMPSNLAVTLPLESTTKVYGSVGRPQMLVASTGIGRFWELRTGWTDPFVY